MAYNTNTTGEAAKVAQGTTVTGSVGSPIVVAEAVGVIPGGYSAEVMFVKSSSGNYVISANPQIAPGTSIGQTLTLIGTDDTDAFAFTSDNGVYLEAGALTTLDAGKYIQFIWTGTVWACTLPTVFGPYE